MLAIVIGGGVGGANRRLFYNYFGLDLQVSTPSDRSGDGDDDYVPNPNSIQAGTGTCISRVGAACGTAACCGGLACTAELCKLDSDAYVPARVDNRDRENTTDFERSSWVAAAETDNTGIVVGAILACLSMVGFGE